MPKTWSRAWPTGIGRPSSLADADDGAHLQLEVKGARGAELRGVGAVRFRLAAAGGESRGR